MKGKKYLEDVTPLKKTSAKVVRTWHDSFQVWQLKKKIKWPPKRCHSISFPVSRFLLHFHQNKRQFRIQLTSTYALTYVRRCVRAYNVARCNT